MALLGQLYRDIYAFLHDCIQPDRCQGMPLVQRLRTGTYDRYHLYANFSACHDPTWDGSGPVRYRPHGQPWNWFGDPSGRISTLCRLCGWQRQDGRHDQNDLAVLSGDGDYLAAGDLYSCHQYVCSESPAKLGAKVPVIYTT